MAEIRASGGQAILVDDDDLDSLSIHRWYVGDWYAMRSSRIDGRWTTEYMHRRIMGLTKGDRRSVDHVNGNPLDNRRANLRYCSQAENMRNTRVRSDNKSGLKGIAWDAKNKKWEARIQVNKRRVFLGRYGTAEEAHAAYREAAVRTHGEFANFGGL
jgi:hypothetical protein